ncbi:MAG TPA: M28 family peptidase, partial [Gemmatimonadales bacterium]|nr:M28 family peptidase [Gemmatimonadales bacterium]
PAVAPSYIPPLPAMLAGPRMTVTLYLPLTGVGSGSWNDAYLNGLAAGLPPPQELPGWRADVRLHTSASRVRGSNVGCVLPAPAEPAPAGRAIVLTAHYDHLGVGVPGSDGDSVYNGFADNAAGVAMVLGIGEAFARERRRGGGLRHALVLLFFAGEEHGLLGSDYFVTHPAWPLARIAGVINLDGNAPAARPRAWRLAGEAGDPLAELVRAEAAREGWSVAVAPPSPGSDYYPFVRRGVPSVFFVPGDGPFEGLSLTASDSLRAMLWGRYHQPGDEYDDAFPFGGLARYAEFAAAVVRRLDRDDGAEVARTQRRVESSLTGPGGMR